MDTQSILERNAEEALRRLDAASLKGVRVMLTGATGLIGVNLEAALKRTGCALSKYKRGGNLLGSYDFIIHAAGYAQPARFMADPLATIRCNTTMLMELFDRLAPKGRLLYLSTSEIYSGNGRGLHRETDVGTTDPAHARASYIEGKRCGEAICYAARTGGHQAVIARVSSVYGPGVRRKDTRVMSQFIDQALDNQEIVLQDAGTARRVFLYVSDCVEMLLQILLHGEQSLYNVGGPLGVGRIDHATTILSLARQIGEILKVPVRVPPVNGSVGHGNAGAKRELGRRAHEAVGAPHQVGVDIARWQREFGDKPFVEFSDGLRRTIEWHKAMAEKGLVAA